VAALRSEISEAEFVEPGGGYFLWLTLDDDVDTRQVLTAAAEEGVSFVAGPDFMLDGGENALRLSFASVPPERIGEGVERIAKALARTRTASPA
jgi:2-aminoadipate transaminase